MIYPINPRAKEILGRRVYPGIGDVPDPVDLAQLKLTALVRNAGCASKIAPADLEAVLTRLPPVNDPAVISGLAAADDAAIYRLTDNLCLVQTVDVFTPCVDDPFRGRYRRSTSLKRSL